MIFIHAESCPDEATTGLIRALSEVDRQGGRSCLIVPAQFTAEAEQLLLERLDTRVLMRTQVKSFNTLTRNLLEVGRGLKRRTIGRIGRTMLVRSILSDTEATYEAFAEQTRGQALVERLAKEIQEYKEYHIGPEVLEAIADDLGDAAGSQRKLRDIAGIYREYNRRMGDRFLDADDRMKMAFDQLEQLALFDGITFFVDGFNSMSKLELSALEAMNRRGLEIHVAITLDPVIAREVINGGYSYPRAEMLRRLMQINRPIAHNELSIHFLSGLCRLQQTPLKLAAPIGDAVTPAIFAHAAASVFDHEMTAWLPDAKRTLPISIMQYRSTEREVDGLIIAINRLIRSGVRYRDIQVILASEEEYAPYITQKFELEGLPAFMDRTKPVTYHPLIRLVNNLIRMVRFGYRQADVLELVKTGFLDIDRSALATYQNHVVRRKIDRAMFRTDRAFTFDEDYAQRYIAANPGRGAVLVERWRHRFEVAKQVNDRLLALTDAYAALARQPRTMRERAKDLYDFLVQREVDAAITRYEQALMAANNLEALDQHAQIWEKIMGLLDQMIDIVGEGETSYEDFTTLLEEGLSAIRLGTIPPFQDGIIVGTISRSRSLTRDHVFVLGMGDINVPSAGKGDDLLTREEQQLLERMGYFLPSMRDFSENEEMLAFYKLLCKTGKHLTLSYAIQNTANEPIEASFWLTRLKAGISGLEEKTVDDFEIEALIHDRHRLYLRLPEALREADGESAEARSQAEAILSALARSSLPENRLQAQRIERARDYDNRRPPLSEETVHTLFERTGRLSASQIERYARCPYSYFIQNGLRPEPVQTMALEAAELGTLVHASIDAWTERAAESPEAFHDGDEAEDWALLKAAFEAAVPSVFDAQKCEDLRNAFVLNLTLKTLEECHHHLFNQLRTGDIARIYHEADFGEGAEFPAVEMNLGDTKLYVEGRIDRVDMIPVDGQAYMQVIDYKTGNRSFNLTRTLSGLDIQLMLYLQSVTAAPNVHKAGAFYFPAVPNRVIDVNSGKTAEAADETAGLLSGVINSNAALIARLEHGFGDEGYTKSQRYALRGQKKAFEEKGNVLSEAELERLAAQSLESARQLMQARHRGEIEARPHRIQNGRGTVDTACAACAYKAVCRFEKYEHFNRYRRIEPIDFKEWRQAHEDV